MGFLSFTILFERSGTGMEWKDLTKADRTD
jgi:hypothetical protein